MPSIYLDNNATTDLDPRVAETILEVLRAGPANPSSLHALGRRAQGRIDQEVDVIGSCLGSRLDQPGGPRLVFTSGGTESNNLALQGLARQGAIVVSRIEHPSVIETAQAMERLGRHVRWLNVDHQGQVDPDHLQSLIDDTAAPLGLVSVMSANNETGVIQPISEIAGLCAGAGIPLHVDATQTVGKLPVSLDSLGVAAVSFSAHKFHGPVGIGALWLAAHAKLSPILYGGQQQLESRPGTEPVALIVGLAEALRLATDEMDQATAITRRLRNRLETELLQLHPDLVVQGAQHERLPGTCCLSFLGTDRQSMLMALDMQGIACSSGSACSSRSSPPSHVLQAMGRPESEIQSAVRFGVSKFSTSEEIGQAVNAISITYKRLRR